MPVCLYWFGIKTNGLVVFTLNAERCIAERICDPSQLRHWAGGNEAPVWCVSLTVISMSGSWYW